MFIKIRYNGEEEWADKPIIPRKDEEIITYKGVHVIVYKVVHDHQHNDTIIYANVKEQ